MHYRLSKSAKLIIIINIILSLFALGLYGYNIHRINVTYEKITSVIDERGVIRETAIMILEEQGEELFLGNELQTHMGFGISVLSLFFLYRYSVTNTFYNGFAACTFALLSNVIGGIALFYIFLSGKSEDYSKKSTFELKDNWERFICNRET